MVPSAALAIVTGTSSGIGAAVASELLDRGWTVVGVARRPAAFDHARYRHVAADLADVRMLSTVFDVQVAPAIAGARWDRVGLVNNAARADLLMPLERVPAGDMLDMLALDVVAPAWLMGFVLRRTPSETTLRIVNVSSGAAVTAFPGLGAYCSSKAALRMAGQVLAAELDAPPPGTARRNDAAILSFQPGVVDTPMQTAARTEDLASFPWGQLFKDFHARGMLVPPERPAREIVEFLESGPQPRIVERRLGG